MGMQANDVNAVSDSNHVDVDICCIEGRDESDVDGDDEDDVKDEGVGSEED